ncbi:hypothetical protein HHL23_22090 [Chryseobacterium sp. RP-3-3]|uniref:Uncharacterized protein n=1 Tax=Chryseobacterium antibioticum TaxID=2728847 RepID=A0A7Y0FU26_9FLAO|nr:hypothetical protein [Chryseobacterium antibioticum]NML72450.1 hypothetical protein [Chryseobacterium antibioticum]
MMEKYYWQKKLAKITDRLKKRGEFKRPSSNIDGELEFNIVNGFYIIRKLIENNKLTNKFISTNIKGFRYPFIDQKKLTPFNNHKWTEFYDLQNKQKAKFDIQFLCNLFVHSFYFIPCEIFVNEQINDLEHMDDSKFHELCKIYKRKYQQILFNSDDKKLEFLYEIDIDKIIEVFETVSLMDITKMSITYNVRTNKYDYKLEMPDEGEPTNKKLPKLDY